MSILGRRHRRRVLALAERALVGAETADFSLITGAVGDALFACEFARFSRNIDSDPWVERAVACFNARGAPPGLHLGLAGLGLVLATYVGDDLLDDIDRAILAKLDDRLPPASLRVGLAGIAVYASMRGTRPRGKRLQRALLERMHQTAVRTDDLVTWHTPRAYWLGRSSKARPGPLVEFGMAHGVAGVIVALAALHMAGRRGAKSLIVPAVRWVFANGRKAPTRYNYLLFGRAGKALPLGGNTWCTGDPGVLRACWLAARVCGDDELAARAFRELGELAARTLAGDYWPSESNLLGLCCGSTIVGHIYHRMFHETGETVFRDAARLVLEDSLRRVETMDPAGGFQSGRRGVLLALLSACTDKEPLWDSALGVSLPRRV